MLPWSVIAERRLPVRHSRRDEIVDAGRAVEHRKLGVGVQMRRTKSRQPTPPRPPIRRPQGSARCG